MVPQVLDGSVVFRFGAVVVAASRFNGVCAKHRGTPVLIEGCAIHLAALALAIAFLPAPSALTLAFWPGALDGAAVGYGALECEARERRFRLGHARYRGPDRQCGGYCRNRCGVFAIENVHSAHQARFVSIALLILSIVTSAALLSWMRRAAA